MTVKDGVKVVTKLVSGLCVDAMICGGTAAVVPLALMNPVIGGLIVVGGAVVSGALSNRLVDPYIDELVDDQAEKIQEVKTCIEIIKKGELPEE